MNFNSDGYLAPGIHDATTQDMETYLVTGFPSSTTRPSILSGYKLHRAAVEALNIPLEQLIDGSFVSTKNDPSDIDMVCFADAAAVDALSPAAQAEFEKLFDSTVTKLAYCCDVYFCPVLPPTDPNFQHYRTNRKYWLGEFGFDRQEVPKGVLRISVAAGTGNGP